MNTEDQVVLDKVAKLMAKAKGTTNENEAAIFAAKAAEILARHNLDEAMLREHEASKEEGPIGSHEYKGRVSDRWRELISMGCAKLYFCQLTITRVGKRKTYVFHGREHNAKVAMLMVDYLIATVKRMAREYSPLRVEQADFRKGAGVRLYERLYELYNAQNAAPKTAPKLSGTTLPVLYKREEDAVSEYIKQAIPDLRTGRRGRSMKMGRGASAGRQAANSISLGKQVAKQKSAGALR